MLCERLLVKFDSWRDSSCVGARMRPRGLRRTGPSGSKESEGSGAGLCSVDFR